MTEKYWKYLHSPEWANVRQQVYDRDNHACCLCGNKNGIQAHHITYRNTYNEAVHLADLMTLCDSCHKTVHDYDKACKALRERGRT